jgi:short-subunit dehydrogenase
MKIMITGAAQGIGAAIATNLASASNELVLVDQQADKLEALAADLENKTTDVKTFAGDLTDATFMSTLTEYLHDEGVDALVNNAAVAPKLECFEDYSAEQLDLVYQVNVRAPFELLRAALPYMQERQGCVVINIASRANIYGYNKMALYAASKAALTSLTGTIALENTNIKALTVIPGRTNTPMQANLRGEEEASHAQTPDYVGSVIAKLISGEISTTSGDHVVIDFEDYKVFPELDKADLHRNMH